MESSSDSTVIVIVGLIWLTGGGLLVDEVVDLSDLFESSLCRLNLRLGSLRGGLCPFILPVLTDFKGATQDTWLLSPSTALLFCSGGGDVVTDGGEVVRTPGCVLAEVGGVVRTDGGGDVVFVVEGGVVLLGGGEAGIEEGGDVFVTEDLHTVGGVDFESERFDEGGGCSQSSSMTSGLSTPFKQLVGPFGVDGPTEFGT